MYLSRVDISKLLLAESITILVLCNKAAFLLAVAPFIPFNIAIIIPAIIIGIIPAVAGASLIKQRRSLLDPEVESFVKTMKIYFLIAMIVITVLLFNLPFLAAIGGSLLKTLAIPCVIGIFGTKALSDYANLTRNKINGAKKIMDKDTPMKKDNDTTVNESFSFDQRNQSLNETVVLYGYGDSTSNNTSTSTIEPQHIIYGNTSLNETTQMYGNNFVINERSQGLDDSHDNKQSSKTSITPEKNTDNQVEINNAVRNNRPVSRSNRGLSFLTKSFTLIAIFAHIVQPLGQFTPIATPRAIERKPESPKKGFLKSLSEIMNDQDFCPPTL